MVLTVIVEVPEPPATEAGLIEHVGTRVTVGATLHVKFTAPAKPLVGEMVIVEVADPPAETVAGERAAGVITKSGAGVTVRLTVVS